MFNSSWLHGLQNFRPLCPSLSPGVFSSSCPLHQWCHPTISSSVTLFFWRQSFQASGSFPLSWLFSSGGQNTGASVSVLLVSIQGWFPLKLTGWISLLSKGLSRVFSSTTIWKHQLFSGQLSLWSRFQHDYWKDHSLDYMEFCLKVMSLLVNKLSRFVIAFLPRNNHLLISWLQSSSAVILSQAEEICHSFHIFPFHLPWSDGTECHELSVCDIFKWLFHFPPSPSSVGSQVPLLLLEWYVYLRLLLNCIYFFFFHSFLIQSIFSDS